VHQDDRCCALVPPYNTLSERAQVDEERAFARDGICGWPHDEARHYYVAYGTDGRGATAEEFAREYDFGLEQSATASRPSIAARSRKPAAACTT
jgi:hypothetical protein